MNKKDVREDVKREICDVNNKDNCMETRCKMSDMNEDEFAQSILEGISSALGKEITFTKYIINENGERIKVSSGKINGIEQ